VDWEEEPVNTLWNELLYFEVPVCEFADDLLNNIFPWKIAFLAIFLVMYFIQ
jgi:hypothetical protein